MIDLGLINIQFHIASQLLGIVYAIGLKNFVHTMMLNVQQSQMY